MSVASDHTTVRDGLVFRLALVTILSGCHLQDVPETHRAPAIATRFAINSETGSKEDSKSQVNVPTLPALRVGLVMQSSIESAHTQFAGNLGTVLSRELQLSSGSMFVTPLATLEDTFSVPELNAQQAGDVISVSFYSPQDTLPSQLPPNPMLSAPVPPVVDQILVVRVIEYRAYFPLLATLEMRVLDGETHDPIFATTATWSGVDYRLTETQHPKTWRDKILCRDSACDPSPAHNSPQALMHEISRDISEWYNLTLTSGLPTAAPRKSSFRQRLMSPFKSDACESCDANRMSRSNIFTPNK